MKKNIIVSLIVIMVLIAGYFILLGPKDGVKKNDEKGRADQSIAVLPFVNMSNEPGQEYFSDGLADGILNSIAHLKGLKVCARTSSFKFKGKLVGIKEIGKKLGVRTILEGSVQRYEDRVRIIVQLINAEDEFHFWSEQYDEKMDNIFSVQDKIANAIAAKLQITILENKQQVPAKPTPTKEAYDLYLKGRASWNLGTAPDFKKAIDFFTHAIALDTNFAMAYSGLADCYNALGYGSFLAPKDAFPKAKDAATKALQLDSTLAEPHASLGFYRFYYDWDWEAAEEEFRTAIALNSNYEIAYKGYGYYLTAMKRYDEAAIMLKKAAELDPLSVPISTDMGFSLYYSGDYDNAIKKLQGTLQINPKYPLAHIWLGRSYQAKQMYPQAIAEYKNALQATPDWPVGLAQLGNVYGVSGNKGEAQKILDTLNSLTKTKFVTSYGMALVYAGLGEKDQAFLKLNNAYEERSNWLVWLKTDPRWMTFRSDKRFARLVSNVGLPE
ncbi:MAG: tetratricopeptide repeat protein [Chitinophagaceae bacterium]|nr:tetratricopeptide repeat protein [Chitinophagaceae bacterium]